MKARAKITDNGDSVEGWYFEDAFSNSQIIDLKTLRDYIVNLSTIEYEINEEWYSLEEIERTFRDAKNFGIALNKYIEQNARLRLHLIEVKGERDQAEKENARLKAENDFVRMQLSKDDLEESEILENINQKLNP